MSSSIQYTYDKNGIPDETIDMLNDLIIDVGLSLQLIRASYRQICSKMTESQIDLNIDKIELIDVVLNKDYPLQKIHEKVYGGSHGFIRVFFFKQKTAYEIE